MRAPILVVASLLVVSSTAAADPARIDAVMKEHSGKTGPGCAVAVIRDGKVTHARGYGMADLERNVPIGPDTVFDIASTSKQITAASILLLAADGKLGLDDDIRKHLPELPALSKRPITIRHLLHHTGGLRDYMMLLELAGTGLDDVATSKETLAALVRQKGLEFEPGTRHAYSNTGYFVLAQIVERASKQSMAAFAAARIFAPLGMARTMILDDHRRLVPYRAIGYAPAPGGGWQLAMSRWEQTGDGAVQTTVLDLARWDANFYDPKVGGRALLDGLHARGKLAGGKVLDYAAGLVHGTYRGQATVSHGGGWAGYRSQLVRFPALRTSVAVLCNAATAHPTQLAHQIADVVLGKQLAPVPAPDRAAAAIKLSAAELDAWAGKYRELPAGGILEIKRDGERLVIEAGSQKIPLTPTSKQAFKLPMAELTIELTGAAPRRKMVLRGKDLEEQYEEVVSYTPAPGELAAYAGRYTSTEAAAEWTIAMVGGKLVASGRGIEEGALVPSVKDELSMPATGFNLRFTRGPRGVTGFVAVAGRLQLRFDRAP